VWRFRIRYLLIGMLLANGMPHFIWGRSGVVARSPFGERTAPKVNLAWGLSNLVAATLLSLPKRRTQPARKVLGPLLLGFWLSVAMFGFAIPRFISKATPD
jgi:hypothetical protein